MTNALQRCRLGAILLLVVIMCSGAYALENITGCQSFNGTLGYYVLQNDINFTGDVCFTFSSNNTDLDLNGHTLTGNGNNTAVIFTNSQQNSIQNGALMNLSVGINDYFGFGNALINLTISDSNLGINTTNTNGLNLIGLFINNIRTGFEVSNSIIIVYDSSIESTETNIKFYNNTLPPFNFFGALNSTINESKIEYANNSIFMIYDYKIIEVYDENSGIPQNRSVWLNTKKLGINFSEIFGAPEYEQEDWMYLVGGPEDTDTLFFSKINLFKNGLLNEYQFGGKEALVKVLINGTIEYFYKINLTYNPGEIWTFVLGQNISLENTTEDTSIIYHHHTANSNSNSILISEDMPQTKMSQEDFLTNNVVLQPADVKTNRTNYLINGLLIGIGILLILILIKLLI